MELDFDSPTSTSPLHNLSSQNCMEMLITLERAANATSAIARGVRPEQFDSPTPCGDWNVEQLMNHLIGSLEYFTARAGVRAGGPGANWSTGHRPTGRVPWASPLASGRQSPVVHATSAIAQRSTSLYSAIWCMRSSSVIDMPGPRASASNHRLCRSA